MPEYPGTERRQFVPCPMHESVMADFERGEKRMDRFESKLDILIEKQQEQAVAIQKLNDSIGNGIRSEVQRTMTAVETLADKITEICKINDKKFLNGDLRLKKLEEFAWFRNWVTGFRDKIILKIMTIVFGVGALIGIVYLIERGTGLLK
jgi:hypothetical protein